MTRNDNGKLNRREFLKQSTVAAAAFTTGLGVKPVYASKKRRAGTGKKVIVIGIDGMDPRLSVRMMNAGMLPNFDKLRKMGGFRALGTSIPPQSPVAWANFINGAGPGTHGIFDFIHRHPEKQCAPFFAVAETVPGEGYWEIGNHKLQMNKGDIIYIMSAIVETVNCDIITEKTTDTGVTIEDILFKDGSFTITENDQSIINRTVLCSGIISGFDIKSPEAPALYLSKLSTLVGGGNGMTDIESESTGEEI